MGGSNTIARYFRQIADEICYRFGTSYPLNVITLGLHAKELTDPDFGTEHGVLRVREATAALVGLGAEAVTICSSPILPATTRTIFPILMPSISEVTSIALHRFRLTRIGLIGPRNLHEEGIWREDLKSANVMDTFVPTARDREHLSRIVTTELARGLINEGSRADVVRIVYSLRQAGARAVVVTVPEIGAMLASAPPVLPVFDAVELHALAAVDWACMPPDDATQRTT